MRHRLRPHLSFANVVSAIALFASLGGIAYAANTVGSSDVIDDSLLSADLKDNAAVRSRDVVNDTTPPGGLQAVDLAPDSVGASELQNGPLPFTNVVARAQGSSSVSLAGTTGCDACPPAPYPLSTNTWTQAANETDFFVGRVTFDAPSGCTSDDGALVLISVDGSPVGRSDVRRPVAGSNTADLAFFNAENFVGAGGQGLKFEPGSPDARTLTADLRGGCATGDITVTSLKVSVIGFR